MPKYAKFTKSLWSASYSYWTQEDPTTKHVYWWSIYNHKFILMALDSCWYGSVSKPCTPGEHQNSWDLWMFIPLKMVLIGIDPYPYPIMFTQLAAKMHRASALRPSPNTRSPPVDWFYRPSRDLSEGSSTNISMLGPWGFFSSINMIEKHTDMKYMKYYFGIFVGIKCINYQWLFWGPPCFWDKVCLWSVFFIVSVNLTRVRHQCIAGPPEIIRKRYPQTESSTKVTKPSNIQWSITVSSIWWSNYGPDWDIRKLPDG
jgi:hypothetical protein